MSAVTGCVWSEKYEGNAAVQMRGDTIGGQSFAKFYYLSKVKDNKSE